MRVKTEDEEDDEVVEIPRGAVGNEGGFGGNGAGAVENGHGIVDHDAGLVNGGSFFSGASSGDWDGGLLMEGYQGFGAGGGYGEGFDVDVGV